MAASKFSIVKDIFIQVVLMGCLVVALIWGFFYLYLPSTTHHGQTIRVPALNGKSLKEVQEQLAEHDLRYEIQDCTFVPKVKPLTVLSQFPEAGAPVKEDRKILLTVSMANPPEVEMPDLVNLSLRNADILLQSVGLQRGDIRYEPAFNPNILQQEANGKPIAKNSKIPKGTRINLVIGDGIGPNIFEVPEVVGKSREDAELLLRGSGLKVRTRLDYKSGGEEGMVTRQEPAKRTDTTITIRRGSTVTIWYTPVSATRLDTVVTDTIR